MVAKGICILVEGHHLLDFSNGLSGVQALGAGSRAVKNGVASVHTHAVVESGLALFSSLVSRVNQPSVGLEEESRSKVFFTVPPVGGARGRAASTENTFIQSIKLLSVSWRLAVFTTLLKVTC